MDERSIKTVNYLNQCISEYLGSVEEWEIIYSLEGWAEYFATNAYDVEVSDYAPKLIEKLEIVKDYVNQNRHVLEADIDFLIQEFDINLKEVKPHLKLS